MPVTFDSDSLDPEYLEKFYREGRGMPWQLDDAEYLRDPANSFRLRLLQEELVGLRPSRVLDVGCGGMALERSVAGKLDAGFTACDLAAPEQILDTAFFVAADAAALPYGNCIYDAVVCSEVLEHLHDPAAALAEIRRVLKPGGHALITVPNWFSLDSLDGPSGLVSNPLRFASKIGLSGKWRRGINTHITRQAPRKWRAMMEKCGFTIEFERPVYLAPYIPYIFKGLKKLEFDFFKNENIFRAWKRLENSVSGIFPFSRLGQFHYFRCVAGRHVF
jgi:SAM-dependent methyltransferase